MKNRFLVLALAAITSLSLLAGCSSSSGSDSSSGTSPGSDSASSAADAEASSDGESYNISVIVKLTDAHFLKVIAGAEAYADEHSNVTVNIQSPTSATAYDEQTSMIETALSNDSYDAVIISPLQSDTASTLVANTDKVIIALDTDFDSEKKTAFVGTGNQDAAKSGALAAAEIAKQNGVEAPTAVILTGVQGDETHDARLEGYKSGIEEAGGEVVDIQYCDALADKAATAMEAIIQKFPEGVDIVLSTNDDMVMSAAKVISDSGSEVYAKSVVCGFDGNQSAIEAVLDGSVGVDVAQLGYQMGYLAVDAAVKTLQGEEVESFIDSGITVVTIDNVEDYVDSMKEINAWEE